MGLWFFQLQKQNEQRLKSQDNIKMFKLIIKSCPAELETGHVPETIPQGLKNSICLLILSKWEGALPHEFWQIQNFTLKKKVL